jgi:hypothetical protein
LTAWKLRLLAHNEAVSGYIEKVSKELMVTKFPSFLPRERFDSHHRKVANITNRAKLECCFATFDTITMQPIDAKMENASSVKNFKIAPFGNTTVSWKI